MNGIQKEVSCKYCHSDNTRKYGLYKGAQRYYCNQCGRKFKSDISPFHMKVPAQYIARALEMFYNSRQIRDIRQDIKTNFSYYPSDSVVRLWIKKYSQSAKKYFENYRPMVSNSWMAVETFYHLRGNFRVMMHDVLDMKTRFVLCSQIATTHNNESLLNAIREASSKAGKIPEILITNQFASLEKAIDSVNEFRNISIQDLPGNRHR